MDTAFTEPLIGTGAFAITPVPMANYATYRDWLRDELAARSARNPSYSLRAFARDLQLRPSHLSDVLKGKLGLSARSATQIAQSTGMNSVETELFVALVESEHARSPQRRESAAEKIKSLMPAQEYRTLDNHIFEIIADWHHFAILELTLTEGFVPKLTWVAERLGISREVARTAVARLKKTDLLEVKNGVWRATEKFPASRSGIPSTAIRRHHGQMLRGAMDALHGQTVEERDFSTMTFAINPSDLPEAKEEIRNFRRHLEKKYKGRANKKEVYALCVQFFRLSRNRRKNEN